MHPIAPSDSETWASRSLFSPVLARPRALAFLSTTGKCVMHGCCRLVKAPTELERTQDMHTGHWQHGAESSVRTKKTLNMPPGPCSATAYRRPLPPLARGSRPPLSRSYTPTDHERLRGDAAAGVHLFRILTLTPPLSLSLFTSHTSPTLDVLGEGSSRRIRRGHDGFIRVVSDTLKGHLRRLLHPTGLSIICARGVRLVLAPM